MGITIESLTKKARELEQQHQAMCNMAQQTVGALNLINSQILSLQEESNKAQDVKEQDNEESC